MSDEARVWIGKRKLATRRGRERFSYHLRWISPDGWKSRHVGTDRKRADHDALKPAETLPDRNYSNWRRVMPDSFFDRRRWDSNPR